MLDRWRGLTRTLKQRQTKKEWTYQELVQYGLAYFIGPEAEEPEARHHTLDLRTVALPDLDYFRGNATAITQPKKAIPGPETLKTFKSAEMVDDSDSSEEE